jgi:LytR cell envelope-related transcriptional attenuator
MSATRPPAFDDRFTTPIEASRRGAHRARPKAAAAGLPVAAGVVVVLLVLGGGYKLLSNPSTSSPKVSAANLSDDPSSTAVVPRNAAATNAATAPATPTTAPATPTTVATTAGGDGPTTGSTTGVNHDINLVVLNSVGVKGLAKKVQADLEPNGWKVARTGNSLKRNLVTTKVYYGRSADKDAATALLKDLGYGIVVRDSTVATKGLIVVLGQDAS